MYDKPEEINWMRKEQDHSVAVITVDSLILDIPINLSLHHAMQIINQRKYKVNRRKSRDSPWLNTTCPST
jgi:hypothetical protein